MLIGGGFLGWEVGVLVDGWGLVAKVQIWKKCDCGCDADVEADDDKGFDFQDGRELG